MNRLCADIIFIYLDIINLFFSYNFNAPTFNIFNISKSHGYCLVVEYLSNINDSLDLIPSNANISIFGLVDFSVLLLCIWCVCCA